MATHRQYVRQMFQRMTLDELLYQAQTIVAGSSPEEDIDREEVERELNRRRGW